MLEIIRYDRGVILTLLNELEPVGDATLVASEE